MGGDVAPSDEAGKRGPHHGEEAEVQRRVQAAGGGGTAGGASDGGPVVSALRAVCDGAGQLADPEQVSQDQQQRIQELERMVGKLTMENALPKRAVAHTLQGRSEASSPIAGPNSTRSRGGVS